MEYSQNTIDRQRVEQSLQDSAAKFRTVFAEFPAGIVVIGNDGSALEANPAMARITGYSIDELRHMTFRDVTHPEDIHEDAELYRRLFAGEISTYHREKRYIRKDGQLIWAHLHVAIIQDGGAQRRMALAMVEDITQRKQAEQQRNELLASERAARSELEKANKAKDEFLAVLSHELRTPLTPILPAVQLMEQDPTLPSGHREMVTMIRRNVELEARLIDDFLLDLTRISKGKLDLFLAPTDVHQKIRHVSGIFDSEIRSKHLSLDLQLNATRHHVRADAARFQQILWNLMKNAVKFTPTDGSIGVRTSNGSAGHICVEVWDTGCGIDAQVLPRIFDAFVQGGQDLSRRQGGLGLGLAISKRLVEMLGGTLAAFSEGADRGSTFILELPLTAEPQASSPERPESFPKAPPSRILLVDDNADTCNIMQRVLQRIGYNVRTADSVSSALQAVDAEHFDLLLCDIGLPDGSGLDLMRQLLAKRPVKGIAISGYGMEEDVRRSKQAGFIDHLTKPVNLHRLESVVREHVGNAIEPT